MPLFHGYEFVPNPSLPLDRPLRQLTERTFEAHPDLMRAIEDVPSLAEVLAQAFRDTGDAFHRAADALEQLAEQIKQLPPEGGAD